MTLQLGTTELHGFDKDGYERRRKVTAICECPTCGNEVSMWSETEEWHQQPDGRWHHSHYDACSTGECCGQVIIDTWEGCFVMKFDKEPTE